MSWKVYGSLPALMGYAMALRLEDVTSGCCGFDRIQRGYLRESIIKFVEDNRD